MGKTIAVVIILAVIVAGGWYFWQKGNASNGPVKTDTSDMTGKNGPVPKPAVPATPATPAPPAVTPVETTMVTYTDSGFSPKEIAVKVGMTVTWKNENTGKQMWVASAPHPTHTDYPEFDAKQASANGGTYSFTFGKVGDWKYHNHMNPTDFGIVHVTQ